MYMCYRKIWNIKRQRNKEELSLSVCLSRFRRGNCKKKTFFNLILAHACARSVYLSPTYNIIIYHWIINIWHVLQALAMSLFHGLFSMFTCVCFFHIVLIADLRDNCQLNCIRSQHKTCTCIYCMGSYIWIVRLNEAYCLHLVSIV